VGNLFELHMRLREDHRALCDYLHAANLLRFDELKRCERARHTAGRMHDAMQTPRLARGVVMAAGIASAQRFCSTSRANVAAVSSVLSQEDRLALLETYVPTPRIVLPPLREILRTPKLACAIGCVAGVAMTRRLSKASRSLGEGMRTALPRVAASLSPDIYVLGGHSIEKESLDTAERFGTGALRWEPLPHLPTSRLACAAATVGGLVYVVGGSRGVMGERSLATCERFDPTTYTWESVSPMRVPRSPCSAAGLAGTLYVVGSEGDEAHVRGTLSGERLDTACGRWQGLAELPSDCMRCHLVGGSAPHWLYAVAAPRDGGGFGVERLPANTADGAARWEPLPPKPVGPGGYSFGSAAAEPTRLYVVGTIAAALVCESLDLASCLWARLQLTPMELCGSPRFMKAISGRLYILSDGWCNDEGNLQSEGVCVDTATCRSQRWLPPIPTSRVDGSIAIAWQ